MASVCIQKCVNDTRDPRVPVRTTESVDAELIKSVRRVGQGIRQYQQPRVVDSISCRQMYLRSYTFSRKETVPEKTRKCFGKVKDIVSSCGGGHQSSQGKNNKKKKKKKKKRNDGAGRSGRRKGGVGGRKGMVIRKVKEMSCGALYRIFHRLLSCATSVDVVDSKL